MCFDRFFELLVANLHRKHRPPRRSRNQSSEHTLTREYMMHTNKRDVIRYFFSFLAMCLFAQNFGLHWVRGPVITDQRPKRTTMTYNLFLHPPSYTFRTLHSFRVWVAHMYSNIVNHRVRIMATMRQCVSLFPSKNNTRGLPKGNTPIRFRADFIFKIRKLSIGLPLMEKSLTICTYEIKPKHQEKNLGNTCKERSVT